MSYHPPRSIHEALRAGYLGGSPNYLMADGRNSTGTTTPFSSAASPTWSFSKQDSSMDRTASNRTGLLGSLKNKLSRSPAKDETSPFAGLPATRRPDRPGMNAFTTPSNEPPPAYSPNPPSNQGTGSSTAPYSPADIGQRPINDASSASPSTAAPARARAAAAAPAQASSSGNTGAIVTSTEDDKYAFLNSFDTIFLIDDSGSMAGRPWKETSQALEVIAPICTAHDADGIDIYFLNAPEAPEHRNVTEASTIHHIFSSVKPQGGTLTGKVLNRILKEYMANYEANPAGTKPLNLIVITDGDPSDDVESVIIRVAKRLDELDAEPWQVGIQMFQVGEEQGAREYLEMLDDELAQMGGGCRDIVDTVPFVPGHRGRGVGLTAENILKVVLGAVNKRLDRRTNTRNT